MLVRHQDASNWYTSDGRERHDSGLRCTGMAGYPNNDHPYRSSYLPHHPDIAVEEIPAAA